jgi:hypothetical protein
MVFDKAIVKKDWSRHYTVAIESLTVEIACPCGSEWYQRHNVTHPHSWAMRDSERCNDR